MTWLRRSAFLILPMLLGLASLSGPGRAQTSTGRFAFADTTLLRDTLGLHFVRLYPLSDSLRLTPDTLRALSVRWRLSLERLVELADSLTMPVDSVGPFLKRESFSVLAAGSVNAASFHYSSGYTLGQANSSWTNGSEWNLSRRVLLLHNSTQVSMDRYLAGQFTSLRQTRTSATEVGWRLGPEMSLGGRVQLQRFDSHDPNSITNESESQNDFQLSMRSRQKPTAGVSSELNVFSGLLDLSNSRLVKHGLSAEANGRLKMSRGSWITNEADGRVTGNLSRTRVPNTVFSSNTHDQSTDLHGTLGVMANSPLGLNVNYALKDSRVESPGDSGKIQDVRSQNNSLDAALRLRMQGDTYISLTGRLGRVEQVQNTGGDIQHSSESTRRDRGAGVEGRYELWGWALDGHFALTGGLSEFPHRDATGGYGESLFVRTVDATLSRSLGPHLTSRANGTVTLSSYRYYRIGAYRTLPVNNDQYRQSYRIEGIYGPSTRVTTALALEGIRALAINIPAASTAGNNEDRTYRAEWRWTYRLLPMLTATQRNLITADYIFYNFAPSSNRLTLDYSTVTGLNAALTPRLTLDLTHNSRQQPSGLFVRQDNGIEAFGRSDEGRNYTLSVRMAYTPTPGLSLSLEPNYLSIRRKGVVNGVLVPQRSTNTLNFSGGVSVNMTLGTRAHLTGDIHRVFRDDRAISYTNGVPQLSPLSQTDFWSGGLQLSWDL